MNGEHLNVRSCREVFPLTHQIRASSSNVVEWMKPTYGRYKCNIDASFSSSLNMVGIRICLRDDMGEFVCAKTDCFSPLYDVDVGEIVDLHTTLKWMADLPNDNVDFV